MAQRKYFPSSQKVFSKVKYKLYFRVLIFTVLLSKQPVNKKHHVHVKPVAQMVRN